MPTFSSSAWIEKVHRGTLTLITSTRYLHPSMGSFSAVEFPLVSYSPASFIMNGSPENVPRHLPTFGRYIQGLLDDVWKMMSLCCRTLPRAAQSCAYQRTIATRPESLVKVPRMIDTLEPRLLGLRRCSSCLGSIRFTFSHCFVSLR